LFKSGKALQNTLEDYESAIKAYETLQQRFPASALEEQTLFNLYYCYLKTGNTEKAVEAKRKLEASFGNGNLARIINHPAAVADSSHKKDGAGLYNDIYNLFIEGKFEEALTKKKAADSSFGKHHWTPQLLYIEAIYHIQQRQDSLATTVLTSLASLEPGSPMAAKAQNLIDVLSRRKQIEDYLTNLPVDSSLTADTAITVIDDTPPLPEPKNIKPAVVTVAKSPANSIDSIKQKMPVVVSKSVSKPSVDSLQAKKKPVVTTAVGYTLDMQAAHYVMLVLEKIDPVYVNEAKNALTRYHKEKYSSTPLEITANPLTDDIRLVLTGKFNTAAEAIDYIGKTKKLAASEIMPWMPANKYRFLIVTEANFGVLNDKKNMSEYQKFLSQNYQGIFD
jgi:outer membrane protein assembly factor BamD (BamD/ComL family)